MVSNWNPELYKLLRRSFWIKAVSASLLSPRSSSEPRPAASRSTPRSRATPAGRRREPPLGARSRPGGPREASGAAPTRSPKPGPRARGPLTVRAETEPRSSSGATEVTPSSGPNSGSYPGRTRPASGWRLSPSSWSSLCPRDRKSPAGRGSPGAGAGTAVLGAGGGRLAPGPGGCESGSPAPQSQNPSTFWVSGALAPPRPRMSQPPASPVPPRPCARRAQAPAGARVPPRVKASSQENCTFLSASGLRPSCGRQSGKLHQNGTLRFLLAH